MGAVKHKSKGSSSTKPGMKSVNSLRSLQRLSHGMSNVGAQQSTQLQNKFPRPVKTTTDPFTNSQKQPEIAAVPKAVEKDPLTKDIEAKQMASSQNANSKETCLEKPKVEESIPGGLPDSLKVNGTAANETSDAGGGNKIQENQTAASAGIGSGDQENLKKTSDEEGINVKEMPKKYTEEEIEIKKKEFHDKVLRVIEKFMESPVRDLQEEGEPYTKECRNCLLIFGKAYFYFKLSDVPYPVIHQYRRDVAQALVDHKCVERFCDILQNAITRMDFLDDQGQSKSSFYLPLKNVILSLMNYSDASDPMKIEIGTYSSCFETMVKLTNDWMDAHLKKELSDDQDKLLKWCIGVFHNVGLVEENIPVLREKGVIQAMIPYMDSPSSTLRLSAVATLASIVNEEEAELLQTHVSSFRFLLKVLRNSLETEHHKYLGWSAEELTIAVRQLARNDVNKRMLVEEGCLPLMVTLVDKGNEDEIKEAIDCLWVLSFNPENKMKLVTEDGLIKCLEEKFNASQGSLKHACHGILWALRDQLNSPDCKVTVGENIRNSILKPRPVSASKSNTPLFKGHIMVSYQWANQELIKRIVQELRSHQIPVWLDIDYMGGSTLQAMAQAVEDSAAVILAMTQRYKDSPNTRAEAEYAFQLRKKIIPLIMQRDYKPDGWLGFILGSKLYYDFSGKYSFESRMDGLLKAVLDVKEGVDGLVERPLVPIKNEPTFAVATVLPPVGRAPALPVQFGDTSSLDVETIKKWKPEDKEKWLAKHDLKGATKLSELSGKDLVFLHNLRFEAPEFFYRCIESKLGFSSIPDLAKVSSALTDLSL